MATLLMDWLVSNSSNGNSPAPRPRHYDCDHNTHIVYTTHIGDPTLDRQLWFHQLTLNFMMYYGRVSRWVHSSKQLSSISFELSKRSIYKVADLIISKCIARSRLNVNMVILYRFCLLWRSERGAGPDTGEKPRRAGRGESVSSHYPVRITEGPLKQLFTHFY